MKFQLAAKHYRKICNTTKNNFIKETVAVNKKKLFKYIKSKRNDIAGVAPLIDENGQTHTDDGEIAQLLNQQYCSVFSKDNGITPTIHGPKGSDIANINFTRNGIEKLLKNIDSNKACGPDNIPAQFLKECAEEITDAFVQLFSASLKQGKVPEDWKKGIVTPIYKGGNKPRSIAENYRPVSLTSISCKIMEHILFSHIMTHLEKDGTLSDAQHGFRKQRSCETQLLATIDKFAKTLNNSEQVDAVLLDFSKAFDKVNHRKLLIKLHHYGIRNKILAWITDFLSNRTQCVVVRGTTSPQSQVESGVPQGSERHHHSPKRP